MSFQSQTDETYKLKYKHFTDTTFKVGDKIIVENILFEDDPILRIPSSYNALKSIKDFFVMHPNFTLEVGCHTDARGSNQFNLKLSTRRSEKIKNALVDSFGVPKDVLTSKGYGETEFLISEDVILKTKEKEEQERLHQVNRRTEIKIIEIKKGSEYCLYNKKKQISKEGRFINLKLFDGCAYYYNATDSLERIEIIKNGIIVKDSLIKRK